MADGQQSRMGVVAIRRNKGERLQRCLRSIPPGIPMVYVDSASIDDSVAFARSVGADVVELDMRLPFSAARARNEGAARLAARHPELAFVQFVDGDCEFEPGWLAEATRFLETEPEFAAVCGRRRERYPEATFYNRLCDAEWDTPPGKPRRAEATPWFVSALLLPSAAMMARSLPAKSPNFVRGFARAAGGSGGLMRR